MDGSDYLIGKNANENTYLLKNANSMDIWFHIADGPSAHLIFKNPMEIDLKTLRKEGIIYNMALSLKKATKYRKTNNITIIYDYCKNVTPLDKPGLVQCKSPKSIRV